MHGGRQSASVAPLDGLRWGPRSARGEAAHLSPSAFAPRLPKPSSTPQVRPLAREVAALRSAILFFSASCDEGGGRSIIRGRAIPQMLVVSHGRSTRPRWGLRRAWKPAMRLSPLPQSSIRAPRAPGRPGVPIACSSGTIAASCRFARPIALHQVRRGMQLTRIGAIACRGVFRDRSSGRPRRLRVG